MVYKLLIFNKQLRGNTLNYNKYNNSIGNKIVVLEVDEKIKASYG